jgi:hypothetical protein
VERDQPLNTGMCMNPGIMYTCSPGLDGTGIRRHKHIRIDQAKLDKARVVLAAATETEALDRALTLVVSEADVDAALRKVAGKGRLRKSFQ